MLVWVFLALALVALTATVVYAGLAARAAKNSAERAKYGKAAVTAGLLTVITVMAGGMLTSRARNSDNVAPDDVYMPNDMMEDAAGDHFLDIETLVATTS
jgi:hypothetical protein